MTLTQKDIDGTYRIATVSDYAGPLPLHSDGETVVTGGRTRRTDKKGCLWETVFTVVDDKTVRMDSTADPAAADDDFCLIDESGAPTRDPVTYTATLHVARKGQRLKLSGEIRHGDILTILTMTKA